MDKVKRLPNIHLTEKGKNLDFDEFKETFEPQFKIHDPKVREKAMKEVYETLTGKKSGNSGIHKKVGKPDTSKDRGGDVEDSKG